MIATTLGWIFAFVVMVLVIYFGAALLVAVGALFLTVWIWMATTFVDLLLNFRKARRRP